MPELSTSSEILSPQKPRSGRGALILLVAGIVVLIAIVVFLIFTVLSTGQTSWQAVFLTNGQTYFGRIVKENAKSIILKNVYYLQMQQIPPVEEAKEKKIEFLIIQCINLLYLNYCTV